MTPESHDDDKTRGITVITPGTQIAHYKVIEKIGEGGMGEVYLADDTRLNRKVALKFLPLHFLSDDNAKARFVREAQSAAGLDHPNVITIFEVSEFDGRPFFAMQYLEGDSLRDIISRGPIPVEKILDIAIQVASGLKHAHEKNIIHRDIKPANICVDHSGRAFILDFGLAAVESDEALTQAGTTLGTIGYMAPEQLQGKEIDGRSDIFSLGVVLYEMLTGTAPFKRNSQASTINSVLNEHPAPLTELRSNIEYGFEEIVSRALDKDVETRYQSASGLLADLKRMKKTLDPESSTKTFVSVGGPTTRSGGKKLALIGGFIGVAVIAALMIILFAGSGSVLDRGSGSHSSGTANAGQWASSIAVLPFMDFSREKDQEYFCDGMTDAIIGKLTGVKELKVISMTSVMRYKSEDRDLEKIGDDLGVETVLDGSVQKEGDNIRVSARLVDVDGQQQLWSRQFDRKLESVFAIQDEISRDIVEVLKIELLGSSSQTLTQRYTDNVEAYNLYVQGRFFWRKRTEDALKSAIDLFEKAIDLDSNYALAYAGLADTWAVLPGYSAFPADSAYGLAEEAAKRAIELNSNIAEGYASLGLIQMNLEKPIDAEQSFKTAIALNPGYSWGHTWYSNLLGQMGRNDESLEQLEIAYELDPLSIVNLINLASKIARKGETERATKLLDRALEIEQNVKIYSQYSSIMAEAKQPDKAIEYMERALEIAPDILFNWSTLAKLYTETVAYDSGMAVFDRAPANRAIDSAQIQIYKGELALRYGHLDDAGVAFENALKIIPNIEQAARGVLAVAIYTRNWKDAENIINVFDAAVKQMSGDLHLEIDRARLLCMMYRGQIDDAIEFLQKDFEASSEERHDIEMSVRLLQTSRAYTAIGDYKTALSKMEESVSLDEKVDTSTNDCDNDEYVRLLALTGNTDRAAEAGADLVDCWIKTNPDFSIFSNRVQAHIDYANGDYNKAADEFLTVLQFFEDNQTSISKANLILDCCLALNEVGRYQETIDLLAPMLIDFSSNERLSKPVTSVLANYVIGVAYDKTGQTEKAIESLETFISFWGDGHPDLRGVKDSRKRLKRLKTQT